MKTIFKKGIFALLIGGATICASSCTNLDEDIYSEVTKSNYYNNADEVIAAMLRPWGHFCGVMQVAQASWSCNELTADGAAWPQKGPHGYDNGDWIRLHRHQWTAQDGQIKNSWKNLYTGIGFANTFLEDLDDLDFEELKVPFSKDQARAELRVYRAYCYWYLMDQFETVPIVTNTTELNPTSHSRSEIFSFVEKEITESIPNLSTDKSATYGRVNK